MLPPHSTVAQVDVLAQFKGSGQLTDGSSHGDGDPLDHHLFKFRHGRDDNIATVLSVEKAIDERGADMDKGRRSAALIHTSRSIITE
jgi:hypothetical protein